MEHNQKPRSILLPSSVVGRVDLGRLLREVENLIEFLDQAAIRQPGTVQEKLPKSSRLLDQTIEINKINLLQPQARQDLGQFLKTVYQEAPVLHMSFSADPSPNFTQKLIAWLRQEIHPFVLLQVGLQPNIGAGCVVRTTNKYFDFSLRERFKAKRPLLIEKMKSLATKVEVVQVEEAHA